VGHEIAVRSPRGFEFVVAFCELPALFSGVLFEFGDPALQAVDIVGAAEAGFPPDLFAETNRATAERLSRQRMPTCPAWAVISRTRGPGLLPDEERSQWH
jgi:hypothetical protein